MRIAIFTNNYLPNPYGVSMSIEGFREEFEQRGHTVYIFAPKFKGYADLHKNVFRYPSVEMHFRGVRFPIAIPYSRKICKVLKELKIDIIHAQHPNLLGSEALRWARKKRVPLVFTWHTLYDRYAHFNPFLPTKISAWWVVRNARKYADHADHIIVPTASVRKIIQKWGVKNEHISAIQSGINAHEFASASRQKGREKLNIPKDTKVLLLVSRLTAEKNVLFLARSVADVLQKNKNAVFVVAGDGDQKVVIQRLLKKENVANQCMFLGVVARNEIKHVYAAADIFVYASKSETQGMIVTEALYSGLPVVAVKAPGVQDLVGNHVSGFLVREHEKEFADAVERLIHDDALRESFSKNAEKIAKENYTSSRCGQKMLEVYRALLESNMRK